MLKLKGLPILERSSSSLKFLCSVILPNLNYWVKNLKEPTLSLDCPDLGSSRQFGHNSLYTTQIALLQKPHYSSHSDLCTIKISWWATIPSWV